MCHKRPATAHMVAMDADDTRRPKATAAAAGLAAEPTAAPAAAAGPAGAAVAEPPPFQLNCVKLLGDFLECNGADGRRCCSLRSTRP